MLFDFSIYKNIYIIKIELIILKELKYLKLIVFDEFQNKLVESRHFVKDFNLVDFE
jgi:hypothetical protein